MASEQSDMKLDGNAVGGLLAEIFNLEMTAAEGTCGGCGAVLMRIVRGRGRYWIDLSGIRFLELAEPR